MESSIKEREFYRNKLEIPLFIVSVILSLAIFALLSYLGFAATIGSKEQNMILQILNVESDVAGIVMKIGGYIAIAVIVFVIASILISYYQYRINAKAEDVHVTEKQLPILIEAEKEYAKKLGIKKLPGIYVSVKKEELEVHNMKVMNPNVIRIHCDEIIISAEKGYTGPKFTIAKHLANIYMGYYDPVVFLLTFFTNWIPILKNTGNRLMAYSTDKIAAELIGKDEAIDAILEESVSIWFIKYMDTKEYIENTKNVVRDKSMFLANLQRDVPIPAYRIDALRNNTEGRLF